ncbi:ribosomal L11 methyltransferase isoform B [Chlorella sorokiniana]|uniref:ETFB lysine methyltransferase n=1 Tax=Chlorella sorokiniana TaxID=3076 RepID=A0A2P6TCJ2_CHLSO|nr:ribosomal L11 methyltransferase isoform B [Chlorella sorokiniana]|eukprot:PRW20360.1 ribosomal L11 methyltransferase isoform B [Chlorella sorokiniana]
MPSSVAKFFSRLGSLLTSCFRSTPDAVRTGWVPGRRQQQQRQQLGIRARAASSESGGSMAGEVCSLKCCLLDVPGGVAEEVAEVLLAYGAQSVAVEEYRPDGAHEQEIFADEHAEGRVWDRCTVVAYFPPEEVGAAGLLETTAADFGLSHQHVTVEAVRTQDWEQSIKDSYQPAQVGEGLWIVPVWSQPPDQAATNIRLEPGLAFGTGDHPTTRLCLRWLQALQQRGALQGAAVMDYGTGSGVLAVAALLMGATRAVGTDIEPLAVKATQSNAALNSVAERLDAYTCAASLEQQEPLAAAGVPEQQRQFEVTVANILQGPLVALAPRLAGYTKPGGLLGLSGILQEQTPAVLEAYGPFFEGFEVQTEDRWALVTAVRKQQ